MEILNHDTSMPPALNLIGVDSVSPILILDIPCRIGNVHKGTAVASQDAHVQTFASWHLGIWYAKAAAAVHHVCGTTSAWLWLWL